MPDDSEVRRDVFVALVGSRPLVVFVENWEPGTIEYVDLDGEPVTYDGEQVWVVV